MEDVPAYPTHATTDSPPYPWGSFAFGIGAAQLLILCLGFAGYELIRGESSLATWNETQIWTLLATLGFALGVTAFGFVYFRVSRWLRTAFEVLEGAESRFQEHAVARDHLERRCATLVRAETQIRAALDAATEGICRLSNEGAVLFANPRAAAFLGPESSGTFCERLVTPAGSDELDQLVSAVHTHREVRAQLALRRHSEGIFTQVEITVHPVFDGELRLGTICTMLDISDRLNVQHQLVHAQKLKAIGELSGGVAHEFNNLLQIIQSNLELIELLGGDTADVEECIADATEACAKGAHLTEQLLAYSRRKTLTVRVIDPYVLIQRMTKLLSRTLGEHVQLATELCDEPIRLAVDEHALESALLNLAVNARTAMPAGGTLTVSLEHLLELPETSRSGAPVAPPAQAHDYVEITVTDTGTGMEPDIVEHVFDPFFTTSAEDGRSGLGLSMVYGFVQQSGGFVSIDTELGKGTSVRMLFPVAADEGPSAETTVPPATLVCREGSPLTVMLVEDDRLVRSSLERMLDQLGHHAMVADGPSTALQMLATAGHVDVLLSDIVMSESMSGVQLAQAVIAARPDIRVVLMSGYDDNELTRVGLAHGALPLLRKPFTTDDLASVLENETKIAHPEVVP